MSELIVNDENVLPGASKNAGFKPVAIQHSTGLQNTSTKSARRNGLYLTNKELSEYNLAKNKFGAHISLNDIVNSTPVSANVNNGNTIAIHEDVPVKQQSTATEVDEDNDDVKSTLSQNSNSTINKRSSIPYVGNRYSSSSYNGSSVRNSKRYSVLTASSSDSDGDLSGADDEDFNKCFFNNPHGRTKNITTLSIHSNDSDESVSFGHSHGGKPGLVGFDSVPMSSSNNTSEKKPKKQVQRPSQATQQRARMAHNSTNSANKRISQISASSAERGYQRNSQISTASSDRSSKRHSLLGSWRHQADSYQSQQQIQNQRPPKVMAYQPKNSTNKSNTDKKNLSPTIQQEASARASLAPSIESKSGSVESSAPVVGAQQGKSSPLSQESSVQQSSLPAQSNRAAAAPPIVAQPSSRIHRLMHSVSIRSGLFKAREPVAAAAALPDNGEKKVQLKRSFFSIRSGLNRSASTLDIGAAVDRKNISLPVPQDQTAIRIEQKLKNSSSIYSLVSKK